MNLGAVFINWLQPTGRCYKQSQQEIQRLRIGIYRVNRFPGVCTLTEEKDPSGNQSKASTHLATIAGYLSSYGSVVSGNQNKRDRKQTFEQE